MENPRGECWETAAQWGWYSVAVSWCRKISQSGISQLLVSPTHSPTKEEHSLSSSSARLRNTYWDHGLLKEGLRCGRCVILWVNLQFPLVRTVLPVTPCFLPHRTWARPSSLMNSQVQHFYWHPNMFSLKRLCKCRPFSFRGVGSPLSTDCNGLGPYSQAVQITGSPMGFLVKRQD